jgi:hypothetical protein
MSAQDDERHLDEKIHHLVERLKRKRYRATRVRRQYIPNGEGTLRPFGIPAVADQGGNSPSRGDCKPSTRRMSCAVAMGTGRRWERWTPLTG